MVDVNLRRVSVLDVDGKPALHGVEIGRASVVYAPIDGSVRRLEPVALVALDDAYQGYMEGRKVYVSTLVVNESAIRPVEAFEGAPSDAPVNPLTAGLPPTTDGIHIGQKYRRRQSASARAARPSGDVVEVFGVHHNHVAYVYLEGMPPYAGVVTAATFHQEFTRIV